VVFIRWNDAVAYPRWLARISGQPWRLPTEAEWEKAARGTDGRIYPGGDTFDSARCNTRDGSIKTTISVGSHPDGESPYHVQDMAGNVWEWTSRLFQPYPYRENDERESRDSPERRVLRGGSFASHPVYARVPCRGYLYRVTQFLGVAGIRSAWAADG
jgi:formylglycine-generating enzyme required for sulfatase activity